MVEDPFYSFNLSLPIPVTNFIDFRYTGEFKGTEFPQIIRLEEYVAIFDSLGYISADGKDKSSFEKVFHVFRGEIFIDGITMNANDLITMADKRFDREIVHHSPIDIVFITDLNR